MRLHMITATVAVLSVVVSGSPQQRPDRTWVVASEGQDHITYIRRNEQPAPSPSPPPTTAKPDCNDTTQAQPQPAPAPLRRSSSQRNLRSGGSSSRRQRVPQQPPQQRNPWENEGDATWMVTDKDEDHITYTRRSSAASQSQGQGQGQQLGQLRRIGTGQDAVLARVVSNSDTEEGVLESSRASSASRRRYSGPLTNDIVHPYSKKSAAKKTKSLSSSSRRRSSSSKTKSLQSPPQIEPSEDDSSPPHVGDIINGWVVKSKSKDHISWERWGARPAAVANLQTRNNNNNRLRSLKRTTGTRAAMIPNPSGQMVEGFPRIFNTYSRAYYVNERNIDQAGSIRTSLSDTTNWNVGDELAGWKVISKDQRGLVWQKIVNQNNPNEDALIKELNKRDEQEEEEEEDETEESESGEGQGPPGSWYLAKETHNSITWKRDGVPADVTFDANEYPRVGDIQAGWKVRSKSRRHITWVRVDARGNEVESTEEQ